MHYCRSIIAALALLLTSQVFAADPGKKLLVIDSQYTEPYTTITGTMLKTLASQGFEAGRNLDVTHVSLEQFEGTAAHIWKYYNGPSYDAVYVAGTIAAKSFLPIAAGEPNSRFVFASVTDPIGLGLIDAFGTSPSRNFTGVSFPVPVKDRLRFLKKLMPGVRTIGLIYGEMPQSISYRAWLDQALASEPEFKNLKIIYRSVPLIRGDNGTQRMAMVVEPIVRELDSQVDVFMAPNDQMGINPEFAHTVAKAAHKPLLGIIEPDAGQGWGATMTIYPSMPSMGQQAGKMVARLLSGESVAQIPAETPALVGVSFDWDRIKSFGIVVPPELVSASKKK